MHRLHGLCHYIDHVIWMAHQQHVRGLAQLKQDDCPWEAVLMDLGLEFQRWHDAAEHIMVMTDFNEDVRLPWIKNLSSFPYAGCFDDNYGRPSYPNAK